MQDVQKRFSGMIVTGVVGAAALALFGGGPSAAGSAKPVRPWCEVSAESGIFLCDFATFEQCMATARGDGSCQMNSHYRPVPTAPEYVGPDGRKKSHRK